MADTIGFVKLFRKLNDKKFDAVTLGFLTYFLINVTRLEMDYFDGDHNIKLKPGQFITSYRKLSKTLNVSEQTCRSTIKKLEMSGFLTHKGTSKYSIYQVQNWSKWQDTNTQPNTQPNTRPTHAPTTKQEVRSKEVKKYTDETSHDREATRRELAGLPKFRSGELTKIGE
jgi:DNA-binding transcriptional regulator YhcF (GntR family)